MLPLGSGFVQCVARAFRHSHLHVKWVVAKCGARVVLIPRGRADRYQYLSGVNTDQVNQLWWPAKINRWVVPFVAIASLHPHRNVGCLGSQFRAREQHPPSARAAHVVSRIFQGDQHRAIQCNSPQWCVLPREPVMPGKVRLLGDLLASFKRMSGQWIAYPAYALQVEYRTRLH